MPIYDSNRDYDGYSNLAGGVDQGRKPHLINGSTSDAPQCADAQNAIFRGGVPSTRPPFIQHTLTFENSLKYDSNGDQTKGTGTASIGNWRTALFQGGAYYSPQPGKAYIMAIVGGRLYRFTPDKGKQTATVFEVPLGRRNGSLIPQSYFVQAGIYLVVQDGQGRPIIYDGNLAVRSGPDQIFTGRFMASGQGRIVLVGVDGLIYFGDIRDGKGRGDLDMLDFTETRFLNEGFPSALPADCGHATAIAFLPQQDAATGVGDCIVFGSTGAEGFTLSIPRDTWKNSQFQRPVLRGIGCCGHLAIASTNNDLFFRSSQDGWRSYRQARAEADKLTQIPLSTNVRNYTKADEKSLLNYASVINFDQRMLMTSTPIWNQGRPYHNGMVLVDFDVLSTFGNTSQPAWDGHWGYPTLDAAIGMRVLQLVEGEFYGEKRAFAFAIDHSTGFNRLFELSTNPADVSVPPITARIDTRSMDFGHSDREKNLYGGDIWVENVTEPTTVTAQFRSDQNGAFQPWDSFTVDPAETEQGDAPIETAGYDPRHPLKKPDETADTVYGTQRLLRRGYEFQARLEWTGRATLRQFRMHKQDEVEASGPEK